MQLWRNRPIEKTILADGLTLEEGWFATAPLDADTCVIGEPAYYQCTWMYLISDREESLLWDTGSGHASVTPVLARHARRDLTVFPSHLHFDHLGGIHASASVVLADLTVTREIARGNSVTPPEHMYFGAYEDLTAPTFEVTRWAAPGTDIWVGARRLRVLHTPGHSPDSVSLWEPERNRLYAGDLIYRGELYAQVPGACLPDYAATLRHLLDMLPQDVQIATAHGQEEEGKFAPPLLTYGDMEEVLRAIETVLAGPPRDGERKVTEYMTLLYAKTSFSR